MNPSVQKFLQVLGVPTFLWNRCNVGLRNAYHQIGKEAFEALVNEAVQGLEQEEGPAANDVLQQAAPQPQPGA